MITQFSIFWVV